MLAEHGIDVQRGTDVARRIDRTDLDRGAIVGGIDLLEIGGRHREDLAARDGIARHAAAEFVELAGQPLLVALAEEIDLRDDAVVGSVDQAEGADVGDEPGDTDAHLDLAADRSGAGDDRIGVGGGQIESAGVEHHLAARSGDFQHDADRCPGQRGRGGS